MTELKLRLYIQIGELGKFYSGYKRVICYFNRKKYEKI
jgi:hypothetical protein